MSLYRASIVLAVATITCATPESTRRILAYAPTEVRLVGIVRVESRYGPPNFGEDPDHDSKLRIPVLVLDGPIDVRADPADELNRDSADGVAEVQIISGQRVPNLLPCEGVRVAAVGTLETGILPSNFTKVVLYATAITQPDGSDLRCH
jgi:hypothetical protein